MSKTTALDIARELKTEEDIRLFLEASFEDAKDDTEPAALLHALDTAARAQALITAAETADTGHTFAGIDDPPISAVYETVRSLGCRLAVAPL